MKRLRALSAWSDAHPIISIGLGFLALVVIGLTLLPVDPPYLDQATHSKGA